MQPGVANRCASACNTCCVESAAGVTSRLSKGAVFMNRILPWFFLAFLLTSPCDAAPACAATVSELGSLMGEPSLPQEWQETTMDDGKPLVMSIVESDGSILLGFTKTGEGLWAESFGVICKSGSAFEARFSANQIRLGPAAGWMLRQLLKKGGKFTLTKLASNQLRIATRGWSGEFSPVVQ